MYSKLVKINAKRERKSNNIYFFSMIVAIIGFYVILSLENQDVMKFLKTMDSEMVDNFLQAIPILYAFSLLIIYVLVYFASSIQFEERRHEFGVYLTFGMKEKDLEKLLLMEDLRNNLLSLARGLPIAIVLTELVSLITAKYIGIGIIGHSFSFSWKALIFTCLGFLLVKFLAFLVLSRKISNIDIGELLESGKREEEKSFEKGNKFYLILGIILLAISYTLGITGLMSKNIINLYGTLIFGVGGTFFLFRGLRIFIDKLARKKSDKKLAAYNYRQVEEQVSARSNLLAACSLMIFFSIFLLGVGLSFAKDRSSYEDMKTQGGRVGVNYTFHDFDGKRFDADDYTKVLKDKGDLKYFSDIFQIELGDPKESDKYSFDDLTGKILKEKDQNAHNVANNILEYGNPTLIKLSGYNKTRKAYKMEPLKLSDNGAALYINKEVAFGEDLINSALKEGASCKAKGRTLELSENLETLNFVADSAITIGLGLIVPDKVFDELISKDRTYLYVNGMLKKSLLDQKGFMSASMEVNKKLDQGKIPYESFLQSRGRAIFYKVATAYITIFLGVILLLVANTIIGVQFLIGQKKTKARYQTLVHLGADYETLCKSEDKQVELFFGLPLAIAVMNSFFGLKSTIGSAFKAYSYENQFIDSFLIVLGILVFELIYVRAVKKNSKNFLWTMMKPIREE